MRARFPGETNNKSDGGSAWGTHAWIRGHSGFGSDASVCQTHIPKTGGTTLDVVLKEFVRTCKANGTCSAVRRGFRPDT